MQTGGKTELCIEKKEKNLEREGCVIWLEKAGPEPGASETARTAPRQGLKAPGAALKGTEPSLQPDTAQELLGRREMLIRSCLVPGWWREKKRMGKEGAATLRAGVKPAPDRKCSSSWWLWESPSFTSDFHFS